MINIKSTIKKELYRVELIADSGNTIIADEPVEKGGGDTGFAPQELLAASLTACTSITLKMYAVRKGWDIGNTEVAVSHEWNAETKSTAVSLNIKFDENLDEVQRSRLQLVANSCPVHKILSNPIAITTNIF